MRSQSDPIRLWNRRQRSVLILGVTAAAVVLAWAAWPMPGQPHPAAPPLGRSDTDTQRGEDRPELLDAAAFTAAIWNPVPPATQEIPAQPPAQAEPPKLQLIGITHDTQGVDAPVLRAALYDPDTDRLYLVASGEEVGAVTVAEVDRQGVLLETGAGTTWLALHDESGGHE